MEPLSSDDVDLLRSSFRDVAKSRDATAALFYEHLFHIAPEVRPMFAGDMGEQRAKMMSTLGSIVGQIHAFETLAPMVEDLARRHVVYGVGPEHYGLVGTALIRALNDTLGQRFSPDIETAWRRAYTALSSAMITAAYPPSHRHP